MLVRGRSHQRRTARNRRSLIADRETWASRLLSTLADARRNGLGLTQKLAVELATNRGLKARAVADGSCRRASIRSGRPWCSGSTSWSGRVWCAARR